MPSFEVKHDSRLSRGISRARAYAAARSKRHFVGAFAVLLGVVILLLPSPYVIEMPGPTPVSYTHLEEIVHRGVLPLYR